MIVEENLSVRVNAACGTFNPRFAVPLILFAVLWIWSLCERLTVAEETAKALGA